MAKWKKPNGSRECGACGQTALPTTKIKDRHGSKHRLCWTCYRSLYATRFLPDDSALPVESAAVISILQAQAIVVGVLYANGFALEGVP